MKYRALVTLFLFTSILAIADKAPQRPLQLPDIISWKRIQAASVASDGTWFAYRVSPAEGDSEVILRNLKDGKDQHFPIGELPRIEGAGGPPQLFLAARDLAISDDGKWAAFLAYPTAKEAKGLKKAKKPVQSRVIVVELATAKKTEFDKVRRFAFSGERGSMLAMHRYPSTPAGPPAAAPPAAGGPPADDKPTGSDLILFEMATGAEMNVGNVSDFAFDKKGNWLAWIIDAQDKIGNGIELRNLTTGAVMPLDNAKATYKGLTWSENGDGLASMRGVENKAWEDKLYTVVAFRKSSTAVNGIEKIVFDPAKDTTFPKGMSVSPNRNPLWLADLSTVTFGIHELHAKKKKGPEADETAAAATPKPPTKEEDTPDQPDMVIWHYKDSRLQPMQQVQENADKNFSFLCSYRTADQKFMRLADDDVRLVTANADSRYAMGIDVRDYELDGNLSGRRYEDIYAIDLKTGERKLAVKKAHYVMGPSPDGSHILYYEDGAFFTYEAATAKSYNISRQLAATFWDQDDDHNVVKPPHRPIGWTKDGMAVLLSDGWDIWKAHVHGGAGVNLTGNGLKDKIRYRTRYRLDADEKGIDLAQPMYLNAYGEWTKKSGLAVIMPGKPAKMLSWEDASYGNLLKAKRAEAYVYTRENVNEYPDYYLAGDSSLTGASKITDANPQQKDFLWTKGSRLVDYVSDKGDKLQGSLYLPANYEPGKSYPTIVYIYEKLSQATNAYPQPGYNGFSVASYTSNGYAVFTPDIVYKVNDPGMSAVWCVLPGVKAAIATGIVDAKRVGIHGHSWGGYQTAFLVTQTKMFAAAIAGAPLTDMIAMYNAVYWNTGTANQPIFESSQGRFTGSPQDNMEAYVRNSPVYHAKNVTTPLIILHNDKDGAVDWTQGIEYFNTLRRMGKPVVMLQYKGENHGLRKPENLKDYTARMKDFFDYRLSDKEPPKWLIEGVPLLKMKDHLDERAKASAVATPAPGTNP